VELITLPIILAILVVNPVKNLINKIMNKFSHTDEKGKAKMVDVGHKPDQLRIAKASGFISLNAETIQLIRENEIKKGDVLAVAQIAGIQAAKQTSTLIPLCHPLMLNQVNVHSIVEDNGIRVFSEVKTMGKTGVEMEALTSVSLALLCIYDMCKAVDKSMRIENIVLLEKIKENN